MFEIRQVLMNDDDGDTGGGGGGGSSFTSAGPLRGGRGSNVGTREKSGLERAAGGAFATVASAATGIPGIRGLVNESDTFNVDLATGRRISNRSDFDPLSAAGSGGGEGGSQPGFSADGQPTAGGRNVASAADLAINRALGFQEEAAGKAATSLEEGRTASQAFLSPFTEAGTSALDPQLAFLGISGPEAERAALEGFTQSPGAQFAQQEEEQALVRNALAVGDAGGGRFRDELATRASGRFGQRLDTRIAQLGVLSGRGQQAASGQANIEQNTAANLSNLFLGTGEQQASAVLGQEVARAGTASEANRIAAQERAQQSQQDAAFQSQLFGLGASIARPAISSFF